MTTTATATKGSWREVKAIEVTRPCGCIDRLFGKDAVPSRAKKLADKACYSCQLKARQEARREKASEHLDISIGDYS